MIVADLFAKLGLQVDASSWSKGDKALNALKGGMAAVVAGFGIERIWHMVEGVSELADSAGKSAMKLGITTEAVQELGYAAKLSDISQGELEGSLTKLQRGLESAKDGTGPFADALQKLKISQKELKGETLDQNLELIAEKFKDMPDGTEKAALAMQLFGRSGSRLIPLLNSGKEGLVELRNEAHELGIVVDTETAKKFEEFNDQQTKLGEIWRGLKTQAVTALLPALSEMVDKLIDWVKQNRELINHGLEAVIKGMVVAVELLAKAFEMVMETIDYFTEDGDALAAVLGFLGAAFLAFGAEAAIAWLLALGPLDLIILAIAAVVAGVVVLIKNWDKVKAAAGRAWDWIKEKTEAFGDYLLSLPGKLVDAVVSVAETIGKAFTDAFELVKAKALQTWEDIKNAPVIKQIIEVGTALRGDATSGIPGVGGTPANTMSVPMPMYSPPMGDITLQTQIDVHAAPGMDEAALGAHIEQKANDAFGSKIRDAYDVMRGGRR